MALKNLQELFIDELKDAYDSEHRITKALPKMIKAASSRELISALEAHLKQTEEHVARLEAVFGEIGEAPARKTCEATVGLLKEGDSMMEEGANDRVTDAALISAAQKVEHYEMATYGCLRDWARLLGHEDAVKILQKTLDEEGDADRKLTRIAQSLNLDAMESEDEGERVGVEISSGRRSNGGTRTSAKHRAH